MVTLVFFAAFGVLNRFVFGPYLQVVKARNARTTELKAKTAHQKEEADKLQSEYETFMRAQRKDVAHWLEEEKKKVADEERTIIEEARNKVATHLAATRKQADEQYDIARKELLPLVGEYSSKIVAKLTGKKVTISAQGASANKEVEETL
jgi:F0F1-type ATP synthase membrane subunit b/b'